MSPGLAVAGAVSGVVIGGFALGMEFAPRRMARAADRVPVLRDFATTECYRCGEPAFRGRAEEMPVLFPSEDPMDALTIRFCSTCSVEMTVADRLGYLYAEAEKHGVDPDDAYAGRLTEGDR